MTEIESKAPIRPEPRWATTKSAMSHVGKWERAVWMVCFWASFIALVFYGFAVFMSLRFRLPPVEVGADPPLVRAAKFLTAPRTFFAYTIVWIVATPLAMYAFARARSGRDARLSLAAWLAIKLPIVLLMSASVFILNYAEPMFAVPRIYGWLSWMTLYEFPLWIFLLGSMLVAIERYHSRFATPRRLDPALTSPPPVHPLD